MVDPSFPHFEETQNASLFKQYIQKAKKSNPMGAAVDVHKVNDYKGMKMFATRDGLAGYAVTKEGELNSVFKHKDAPYEEVARRAAEHGHLIGGATHLSAFGDKLPEMYAKGGFRPLSAVQWNEQYKPKNWKVRKQGRPDVVFMGSDRSIPEKLRQGKVGLGPLGIPHYGGDYDANMQISKNYGESHAIKRKKQ